MQKGLKSTHGNAPLSAARQRVKHSWKALKQSLTKSKSQEEIDPINKPCISVTELVEQNVESFLTDTDDYDGISELFEKYQHERDAFNRLKERIQCGDHVSEFSEISSISDLSLSSNSDYEDDDADTIISNISSSDIHKGAILYPSFPGHISSQSLNHASIPLPSTCNVKKLSSSKCSSISDNFPLEKTKAIVRPLPSVMKPSFVPDISELSDSDKSNVLAARACAQGKKMKSNNDDISTGSISNIVHSEIKRSKTDNLKTHSNIHDLSKILDEEKTDIFKSERNANDEKYFPGINQLSDYRYGKEDIDFSYDDFMNSLSGAGTNDGAISFNERCDNNKLPLVNTDATSNDCLPRKGKFIKGDTKNKKRIDSHGSLVNNNNSRTISPLSSDCGNKSLSPNSIPRYKFENMVTNPDVIRQSNLTVGQMDDKGPPMNKPLNISRSTMEKYPHIFASYLVVEENSFHSLPILNTNKNSSLSSLENRKAVSERQSPRNSIQSTSGPPSDSIILSHFNDDDVLMVDENYFIVYPETSEKTLICGNTNCTRGHVLGRNDRGKLTACPSCQICYCSRICRHNHWPEHKETCLVGFVNFYVHTFFRRCEKDVHINEYLGNMAQGAYQTFGRGCIMIRFQSPSEIEYNAISCGLNLSMQPVYKSYKRVLNENKAHRHIHVLCQNMKDYDPDQEYVLSIFVWIGGEYGMEENTYAAVVRSARISINSSPEGFDDSILPYGIRTFSLPTAIYRVDSSEVDMETRRYYCKEIAFGLKRYGVHLKSEYPEAYEKLYRYIDQGVLFTPIILYGKRNNRNFKCILYSGKIEEKTTSEYYGAGAFV